MNDAVEGVSIWTVYDKPLDYPEQFVARRFEVFAGLARPTDDVITSLYLERIRMDMQARGLYRLDRNPNDEPCIVECWL